jgi:hypothetical protein
MRRLILVMAAICGLLIGAAGVVCAAGAKKSVERVFPERFGLFSATGAAVAAANPEGAEAQEASEAGLLERMSRSYSDGKSQVSVTISEFRDPTGAYEGYTFRLHPGMEPSTAGPLSAVDGGNLILEQGDFLVQISGAKSIGENDLQDLVKQLKAHADQAPLPPVRGYLPEGDLVDGSQRYAQGAAGFQDALNSVGHPEFAGLSPQLGFATGAEPEVMTAQYRAGANRGVLLLIAYPNPQLAEQHLRHLLGAIPNGSNSGSANAGSANGTFERKGSLLSIVIAPTSKAFADRLRQSINYETQVTWNEPSTTATDPPIVSTLVKIFVGTGVFMLVALVLGIAFGGVRVLTKRFFPGKVFDRPEQMEVLQLGLSGKRIDPRDFY